MEPAAAPSGPPAPNLFPKHATSKRSSRGGLSADDMEKITTAANEYTTAELGKLEQELGERFNADQKSVQRENLRLQGQITTLKSMLDKVEYEFKEKLKAGEFGNCGYYVNM